MKGFLMIIAGTVLCITACRKTDDHVNDRWVRGTIYAAADSLPLANTAFKIYQHVTGNGYDLVNTRSFSTNENGSFTELLNARDDQYAYICIPGGDEHNFLKSFRINGKVMDVGRVYVMQ